MNEFELIRTYFAPLAGPEGLGLTDDAAIYSPQSGFDLVITTDMMVEGVHFPMGEYGQNIAQRLLRVNLSDLAAKGAKPAGYQLSLAWPKSVDYALLADFAKGLKLAQETYGLTLWGGDTVKTSGPMTISATLIGLVPSGTMLRRSGAKVGDDVWVTETIGQGYLGLKCLQQPITMDILSKADVNSLIDAYYKPAPHIDFGIALRGVATASADISDGLLADAGHIAKASQLGLELILDDIPFSDAAQKWIAAASDKTTSKLTLLSGGDDYQIVFTSPTSNKAQIHDLAKQSGATVTHIGKCTQRDGITLLDQRGNKIAIKSAGYQHF